MSGYSVFSFFGKRSRGGKLVWHRPTWAANSPNFPSLHLRHSSFSNPSVALPSSQLILQSFRCFTYVTDHSSKHLSLLLRHRFFAYVTWRAAHGGIVANGCCCCLLFNDGHVLQVRSPSISGWYNYVLDDKHEITREKWALLILQPFRHFTYVTAHSTNFPSLHLRHNSFSNHSVALLTSPLILQPFRHITYVTTHSSNPSVASPTSQLVLQPFRHFIYVTAHSTTLLSHHLHNRSFPNFFCHFTYVTAHSTTLLLLHLCHRHFTFIIWWAAHDKKKIEESF